MDLDEMLRIIDDPSFTRMLSEKPQLGQRLKRFQEELKSVILEGSHDFAKEICNAKSEAQGQFSTRAGLHDFQTMRAISQRRETDARESKRAADGCMFSVVANVGNLHWDPCDPNTYCALEHSFLWKILNLDLGSKVVDVPSNS